MSDRILVSTRKGLFTLARANGAWAVDRVAFLGDNVNLTLADPRDGGWYAALDLGHFGAKLHRSHDRGLSWSECAVPAYGDDDEVISGDGKPPRPATLRLLWALAPGGSEEPGRLWAGTLPGGLFRSDDRGASWQLVRTLWDRPERHEWNGGGYDDPGLHSICVDPRDARRLRVAVSTGGVWGSDDGGGDWWLGGEGLRGGVEGAVGGQGSNPAGGAELIDNAQGFGAIEARAGLIHALGQPRRKHAAATCGTGAEGQRQKGRGERSKGTKGHPGILSGRSRAPH